MTSPELFFDSSALFAGIISASGASRALLLLAEAGQVAITVSEQVVAETERAVARKIPRALSDFREAIRATGLRIVRDPSLDEIGAYADIIAHHADVPIVVAAMQSKTDYLVTLNRRHFIDDPAVADRSKLRIGTPGDALAWARRILAETETQVVTGALAIDPDAEPKLADRLAKVHNQGAILCTCDCA